MAADTFFQFLRIFSLFRKKSILQVSAVFFMTIQAHAECPVDVGAILTKIGAPPTFQMSQLDFSQYEVRVWKAHIDLAAMVWRKYIVGVLRNGGLQRVDECLASPLNQDDFLLAINKVFRDSAFERIKSINPKVYLTLSEKFDFDKMIFRVFDPAFDQDSAIQSSLHELPAGFNDAGRAIFTDAQRIQSEDWDITFIHELGHFIDPITSDIVQFTDQDIAKTIANILKTKTTETLSDEDRSIINSRLQHGLNIGFLAEWRVWCFTVDYVGSSNKVVIGPKFSWMKPLLKMKRDQMKAEVFRYLDPRFSDPQVGIYSNQIISGQLKKIRADLRANILSLRSLDR
jgi:hypothetical protein